ncbi:hypothetical protein CYY_004594 [Polysphondylium violaceum]|uniref:Uncharacterized protein n=1 Tax=Polysphondylium violaceum TaxID=133409 RepID=A0A8J4PXU8_9MYCE|nr:hypothetical protein CYY_004594 [Polysphondylium violaceum]
MTDNYNLNQDQEFLKWISTFSNKDIRIGLNIKNIDEFNQFLNHKYKYLINSINFTKKLRQSFDLVGFDKIVYLSLKCSKEFNFQGTLPESIRELELQSSKGCQDRDIDGILSQLGNSKIRKLSLPLYRKTLFLKEYQLPMTLCDFNYLSHANSFQFIFPNNQQVFKNCKIIITSKEDLKWAQENKCISNIGIGDLDCPITLDLIPSQINQLEIKHNMKIDSLPDHLEKLTLSSHLGNGVKLGSKLEYFSGFGFFREKLTRESLPFSLKTLLLHFYDQPLDHGLFHNNLSSLTLSSFNQPLERGVLPETLTQLYLPNFNLPLESLVLPSKLKELDCSNFNNTLESNSLPKSLTKLCFPNFTKSFPFKCPLDNLKRLSIHTCNNSVINIIGNLLKIKLIIKNIDSDLNLRDTCIQQLIIKCTLNNQSIRIESLPKHLQTLYSSTLEIKSLSNEYSFKFKTNKETLKKRYFK